MAYELQETRGAYMSPKDRDYETVKVYSSLAKVASALRRHLREMKRFCGPQAWTHNHRILWNGKEIQVEDGKIVVWSLNDLG